MSRAPRVGREAEAAEGEAGGGEDAAAAPAVVGAEVEDRAVPADELVLHLEHARCRSSGIKIA